MNNIEVFYKNKKLLELVEAWSYHNNSFFFRIYYSGDNSEVKVNLEKAFVERLKENEKIRILEIITSMLSDQKMRHKIEDFLIDSLEKTVKNNKEQIQKDLGIEIPDEGISDPRD